MGGSDRNKCAVELDLFPRALFACYGADGVIIYQLDVGCTLNL